MACWRHALAVAVAELEALKVTVSTVSLPSTGTDAKVRRGTKGGGR
ncbi:hypothetical protein [Corallococcus sp. AB030]|nr:hypothetical protein [Corallococcus sp. AB030]